MRILHVQGIFSPEHGGPTRSLANYCRCQAAAGHQVSAWVLEGFPEVSPAIRLEPPIEMRAFSVDPPARLGRSSEMRRQLRNADAPDVYHLHGAWLRAMAYGASEARRRRRPCVLEVMGMYEPWALTQKWLTKRVARWCFQDRVLRDADCLHVNSSQEAEYLQAFGFKRPMAVIPVGVDLGAIARRSAGLPSAPPWNELNGQPYALFLSRLHPKKGLDLLLRSWAKLQATDSGRRQSENGKLVIAGTGAQSYVEECRQLAAQLGVAAQCIWLGHVDELQKSWLFAHAGVYVLPTQSENFGNVVAEALAHKTPVITTRHTPWTELASRQCGWLVDCDEADLGRALKDALEMNDTTRKEMGERGERFVREKHSLTSVCSSIEAVYQWLLGERNVPDCVELP